MEALINPTHLVSSFGYLAIFILSVAQSCCVPTSSELTMGFAGALAATGHLSLPGVIVAGVTGEIVGAYIAWVIGRTAGRTIVDRYGKYLLLTQHDLDRAEAWYDRHERWGVFGGRLLPVIRNFVALPAGVAEVPPVSFGLLTAAGSLIWDSAWAGIGYGLGSRWHTIVHAFSDAGYVLGALAVIAIVLLAVHRWRSYGAQVRAQQGAGEGAPIHPWPSGGSLGRTRVGGGAVEGTYRTGEGSVAVEASPAAGTGLARSGLDADLSPRNPREELTALVGRLAEPGAGPGERTGAAANERLTAAAAAVLFVLLFVEGLTLLKIHSLVAIHVIIGLVLVPPVLVKLGSTSWRFVRYYTGRTDYVRKGPPKALLRVLAPFLVLTTVVLFASGIALVVVHQNNLHDWVYAVHRDVFVVWFVILAVHVLAYMWQVPGILRRDVSQRRSYRRVNPGGRLLRLWLVSGSIVAGVALAVLVWPSATTMVHAFLYPHVH